MRQCSMFVATLWFSLIFLLSGAPVASGQVVSTVPSIESHVEISKLEVDSTGETHFSTEKKKWMYWFQNGRRTVETPATGFQFYHIKKNLRMGFHPAPRKQFLLILGGILEIEASGGERRQFSPGSVVLLTDTVGSRGHISRVIGPEDVFAAVIPIP